MENLVSVVIPAYRVGPYIERCLDNILKQSYQNIEIIVVYDESPDNTLSVLKQYKEKIKLINTGRKTSPAIARNIGLAGANGEYIAFCDGDDFFDPKKIEKQVHVLDEDSDIGLVYTDFIVVNEFSRELKGVRLAEWERKRWLSKPYTLVTSSLLIRKNVLNRVRENGYYFDRSLLACEDFDLLIRLSSVTEFKRLSSFLTYYRLREEQLSKEIMKTIIMEAKVLLKHGLYANVVSKSTFELSKMLLNKVFLNPLTGFGLFVDSNTDVKDTAQR